MSKEAEITWDCPVCGKKVLLYTLPTGPNICVPPDPTPSVLMGLVNHLAIHIKEILDIVRALYWLKTR